MQAFIGRFLKNETANFLLRFFYFLYFFIAFAICYFNERVHHYRIRFIYFISKLNFIWNFILEASAHLVSEFIKYLIAQNLFSIKEPCKRLYNGAYIFNPICVKTNRVICFTWILHVHAAKLANTCKILSGIPLPSSSPHSDMIYSVLLDADPITPILWYRHYRNLQKAQKLNTNRMCLTFWCSTSSFLICQNDSPVIEWSQIY